MTGALFDLPDGAVRIPNPPAEGEKLSAGRRLTARQLRDVDAGRHPLTGGPQDPDPAHRCGNCTHRNTTGRYPKCHYSNPPGGPLDRVTGGPATDVRAWWPGCLDWTARTTTGEQP